MAARRAGWENRGKVMAFLIDNASYSNAECLVWPFAKIRNGYGKLKINGKMAMAHRVMCEMAHGVAPFKGAEAAHSCGNGHLGCVNPRHLRWATRQENCDDTEAHGKRTKGGDCWKAKLSEMQIVAIRNDKRTLSAIASEYGCSPSNISHIKSGHTWAWVKELEPAHG